jgi:hypothetical protein
MLIGERYVSQVGSILVLVLAVLLVVPPLTLAAAETISGKVEKINVETGTLSVETDEDESKEMTVPKEMLQGL